MVNYPPGTMQPGQAQPRQRPVAQQQPQYATAPVQLAPPQNYAPSVSQSSAAYYPPVMQAQPPVYAQQPIYQPPVQQYQPPVP